LKSYLDYNEKNKGGGVVETNIPAYPRRLGGFTFLILFYSLLLQQARSMRISFTRSMFAPSLRAVAGRAWWEGQV
jgi:hypothetical protein